MKWWEIHRLLDFGLFGAHKEDEDERWTTRFKDTVGEDTPSNGRVSAEFRGYPPTRPGEPWADKVYDGLDERIGQNVVSTSMPWPTVRRRNLG